jgi:predicted RNase H-like HicB family nuclease
MNNLNYTYWQDSGMWIGYIDEYKDYMTQGESLDELKSNLIDIYNDLAGEHIPMVRHHSQLMMA